MLLDAVSSRRLRSPALTRLLVCLVAALGLFVTSTVVAAAAPTPRPPASASPSASPGPVRTESTTTTPRARPRPTVVAQAAAPPSAGERLIQRFNRTYPWRDLPAAAHRALATRPPDARPPAAPGQLDAFVLAFECQSGTDPVTANAAVINFGDLSADVVYQASRAGDVVDSGALSIPSGEVVEFVVDGLGAGIYQLTFSNTVGGPSVLTVSFRVLTCVTTQVSCAAITFSNPASNPAVEVLYGSFDEEEPDGQATLAPGENLTVTTRRSELTYIAVAFNEESDAAPIALAGFEENVAIPNGDCRVEIDSIDTSCATPGEDDGSARAEVEIVAGSRVRYLLTRAGRARVVERGSAPARDQTREDEVKFTGLDSGRYVLRAYVGGEDDASDRARFTVKQCRPPVTKAASARPLAQTGGAPAGFGLGALGMTLAGIALLRWRRRAS